MGDFSAKRKESDLDLGQVLHTDELKASVDATIGKRAGKIIGAIYEVKSIVEEILAKKGCPKDRYEQLSINFDCSP